MDENQLGLFGSPSNHESKEEKIYWHNLPFLSLDVETSGLDPASNRVIELALVPFNQKTPQKEFCELININEDLPKEITNINGISNEMLKDKPSFSQFADEVINYMHGFSFIVAYNVKFDRPFLESEMARIDKVLPELPWIDPLIFVSEIDKYKKGKKLTDAAARWGVTLSNAHRANADAKASGDLLLKMKEAIGNLSLLELLNRQKILSWKQAQDLAEYRKKNAWSVNR